jgi:signal transduction histidine kinase/CheY-like chemotaxis protein/HPt (histidine-containing phosphotransfer) domain-containing protein
VELKGVVVEDGGASQFLLMFRDLTSETELTEEFSRLASIPEESPFPIIEVNAAGHLLYANPSMVRLMEQAQFGPDGFSTVLPEHFPELAAHCFAQGQLETNINVQVGDKYYAWSFSPHPELGRLRGFGMDITESMQAAAELAGFADTLEAKNQELDQALMKAEAATRAKAAFLATMSHEIRTPLNGVIGMAELLLNSSLDMDQKECTQIIRKSGEGLLTIINDILDFSKIESGHMALEKIGFNPVVLVEEVVDLFSERAYPKGLDIAAHVSSDIPRHLLGDPHRLRQILSNFISNALKFTKDGSVLIEVRWLKAEDADGGGRFCEDSLVSESLAGDSVEYVRFSVKDTGIGISEAVQQKIFQVFMQADSSMSRKYGGSGLGLAICRQIAELMDGRVGVTSQVGEGAMFWCDLPFSTSMYPLQKSAEYAPGYTKDLLVCCSLSSMDLSIEVLSRYCQDKGVRVVRVYDIQGAFAFLQDRGTCLSDVLGIVMGKETSTEKWMPLFEMIQAAPFSELRLLTLTPFWLRKGQDTFPVKFDDVITMPIHRDQLYRVVFDESDLADLPCIQEGNDTPASQEVLTDLPAKGSEDGRHGEDSMAGKRPGRPSVLIVEDNPINQKVAAGLFEKLGCQVYIAESGPQALTVVLGTALDVIMMDWELPGMDGFETARAIRELEKTISHQERRLWCKARSLASSPHSWHIPIVGMTAHGLTEQSQHQWGTVMDDCLSKPIHMQDLARVLDRWVWFRETAKNQSDSSIERDFLPPPIGEVNGDSVAAVRFLEKDQGGGDHYDLSEALKSMEGDEALLYSLFKIFLETNPPLIQRMNEAVVLEDRASFHRLSHQLKGALYAINACHQAKLVERLEAEAMSCPFPQLQCLVDEMGKKMNSLVSVLTDAIQSWEKGGGKMPEKAVAEG